MEVDSKRRFSNRSALKSFFEKSQKFVSSNNSPETVQRNVDRLFKDAERRLNAKLKYANHIKEMSEIQNQDILIFNTSSIQDSEETTSSFKMFKHTKRKSMGAVEIKGLVE